MISFGYSAGPDMLLDARWDPCIAHRDTEVDAFVTDYFATAERRVLFIAGAGFDPRSTVVATRIVAASGALRALLFQENRPNPPQVQIERASVNTRARRHELPDHSLLRRMH
jgi:hypothetical protein